MQLYIKHAVDSLVVESNWGRVFYTNLWASVIAGLSFATTEPQVLRGFKWSYASAGALLISCILGVSMSYFAFLCRAAISATYFTVIGNVCKVITVLINVAIWEKHASPTGLGCLFMCLFAAFFYEQSPRRAAATSAQPPRVDYSEMDKLVQTDSEAETPWPDGDADGVAVAQTTSVAQKGAVPPRAHLGSSADANDEKA